VDARLSACLDLKLVYRGTRSAEYRHYFNYMRYYFTMFLELSNIAMPFVKATVSKVSAGCPTSGVHDWEISGTDFLRDKPTKL
jgi:hypothetical protein